MSHLATWQRKPRIGIDHAVAASEWARRTDDVLLQAYAADVAARAYAADGQYDACLAALDTAQAALGRSAGMARRSRFIHFYDDSMHASTRGLCYLELGLTDEAVTYTRQSLMAFDPSFVRNVAITTVELSAAYIQSNQIEEAARLLGDACQLATRNHSVRLVTLVHKTRATMKPWEQVGAVRSLDERMASYGLALSGNM
jgi:tetratricopeptide (TPR) repeat protein